MSSDQEYEDGEDYEGKQNESESLKIIDIYNFLSSPQTRKTLFLRLTECFGNTVSMSRMILINNNHIEFSSGDGRINSLGDGNVLVLFPRDQVSLSISENIVKQDQRWSFLNKMITGDYKGTVIKTKIIIGDVGYVEGCYIIILKEMELKSLVFNDFDYYSHLKSDLIKLGFVLE